MLRQYSVAKKDSYKFILVSHQTGEIRYFHVNVKYLDRRLKEHRWILNFDQIGMVSPVTTTEISFRHNKTIDCIKKIIKGFINDAEVRRFTR